MGEIEKNKEEYIKLLRKTNKPNIDKLIQFLTDKSDFFTAPASSKYHSCYDGGLCEHSLKVYNKLKDIVKLQYGENSPYPEESLIVVSLCHDFGKINFYEKTCFSKKYYWDKGTKKDKLGNFDWVEEIGYKIKDFKERYLYGSHSQNSEYITSKFINLTDEESMAIIWHMGGVDDFKCSDLSPIYNDYPLTALLHAADYLSTYLDEHI